MKSKYNSQESKGGCDYLKDSSGEVQFSDVSLRYAADEKYVLRGINFKIESKEKVNYFQFLTIQVMSSRHPNILAPACKNCVRPS